MSSGEGNSIDKNFRPPCRLVRTTWKLLSHANAVITQAHLFIIFTTGPVNHKSLN